MKRSEMALIARHTTSVTCSKNLISLEFFANFLFQDKKLGGLACNPKLHFYMTILQFMINYLRKLNPGLGGGSATEVARNTRP